MLYFYLWVAVLASVLLSVPVAAYLEKSRNKKAAGPVQATDTNSYDDTNLVGMDDEPAVVDVADDGMDGFGAPAEAGGDDFSAFDDFK